MKRQYITLYFLAIIALTSTSQTTRKIELSFSPDDFILYDSGQQGLFIHSSRHTAILKHDTHSPALPYVCTYIAVDSGEELQGFTFNQSEQLFKENADMAFNPTYLPTNKSAVGRQQAKKILNNNSFPHVKVEYTGVHVIEGVRVLSFLVCPFRYDAQSRNLYLNNIISLSLSISKQKEAETGFLLTKSGLNDVKRMVVNPNDVDSYYGSAIADSQYRYVKTIPTIDDTPLQYLIVTRDSLKDEFQRLADWKTQKGCKAEVITLENIFQSYQTGDATVKIKTAIKDYWQNSNGNLKYVLIGGSRSVVNNKMCHGELFCDSILETVNSATDTYYACLNDIIWDNNNNNINGDLGDSISLSLSVCLSRLPANNRKDAKHMVDRILEYEMSPNTDGWKNELLMCAVARDSTTYTDNYGHTISEAERSSELMYSSYIPTTWTGSKYRFYDTNTDNPNGAYYDVTPSNFHNELKKGYAFINVMTHGARDNWTMEGYYTHYYDYMADTLNSPRYSAITTEACSTLETFPNEPNNLGTAFLRNPYSGVLSYYGSTSTNWYSTGGIGPGAIYSGEFLKLILGENKSVGEAMKLSKMAFLADVDTYTAQRWNHLFLNLLGDPETHLYTSAPNVLDHVSKELYHDEVIFHGNGEYCACVMSRHDNGESAYVILDENTHSNDRYFQGNINKEYLLTVTAPGCIADRTIYGISVKLQNEKLNKGLNVLTYSTEIGSNIAVGRNEGPVAVEDGSTVINSINGVTIYNDFEVKLGAELNIFTN